MTDNKNLPAYRLAYETANKKTLVIFFDTTGEFFYIAGLPYKTSNMVAMTQRLNERIERMEKNNG